MRQHFELGIYFFTNSKTPNSAPAGLQGWQIGSSHLSSHTNKKTTLKGWLFCWWALFGYSLRSFTAAISFSADRRAPARLCLVVKLPFSGVLTFSVHTNKKTTLKGWLFCWWALRGSNSRPSRCKRDALPAELSARPVNELSYTLNILNNQALFLSFFIFFHNLSTPTKKSEAWHQSSSATVSCILTN